MGVAPSSIIRRLPVAALAFVAGAVLLLLGVPRTIAAIVAMPGNPVLERIQNQEPVSREELEVLITSRKRSIFWAESGRDWADLGLARLLLAAEVGEHDDRGRALINEAISSLKTGLSLAPANPYAWTRLAYAESLVSGPSLAVAQAAQMAILTAPYEPRLLFSRLDLCFLAWPYFEREDYDLVFRQVRFAWEAEPDRVLDLARQHGRINVVRAALLLMPEELSRFEKRLKARESQD